MAGDAAWIVGSIALLALHAASLSPLGLALLAGQAIAVAGVLVLKLAGARALARHRQVKGGPALHTPVRLQIYALV